MANSTISICSSWRRCRTTGARLAALSEKIGVVVSSINDRIKRLVRFGAISGFHVRIAPDAVGLNLRAFILVNWQAEAEAFFLEKSGHRPMCSNAIMKPEPVTIFLRSASGRRGISSGF